MLLRQRANDSQCKIRPFANAAKHMLNGNSDNAGGVNRFGRPEVTAPGKRTCRGKALASGQDANDHFLAGGDDLIEFQPAIDDDEKGSRWVALPKQRFPLRKRHNAGRRGQLLNHFRRKAAKDCDARDALQITGRRYRRVVPLLFGLAGSTGKSAVPRCQHDHPNERN